MRGLDSITDSVDMRLSKALRDTEEQGSLGCCKFMGLQRVRQDLVTKQQVYEHLLSLFCVYLKSFITKCKCWKSSWKIKRHNSVSTSNMQDYVWYLKQFSEVVSSFLFEKWSLKKLKWLAKLINQHKNKYTLSPPLFIFGPKGHRNSKRKKSYSMTVILCIGDITLNFMI